MSFVTEKGLNTLKNYKYKSSGSTWLDKKLDPFWNWFVSKLPMVNFKLNVHQRRDWGLLQILKLLKYKLFIFIFFGL